MRVVKEMNPWRFLRKMLELISSYKWYFSSVSWKV